jgi:hypothetical protein
MKDTNLDFDGLAGDGVNRAGNKYSGNYHGGQAGGNYGMGPRKGNTSSNPAGAPKTIATASQGGKINGGATAKGFGNADKINVGIGPRVGNK